ncbi:LysR family transcriptional regulator [Pelagibius sp. 7325]|uniref:LysR family transcriptional regulator n=1 Tax=Pelagibius sp. 7325 TaxID=3131994 RepID=UPI0030EDC798
MEYSYDPQSVADERRLPTPRMMEAFHAVMEAGSVSAAARYLGVSQPAVSRLLKQFEEELGFPLFHRAKGKLTPTPEAHRLSIDVGNALDGIDRVRRSAEDVRRHGTGRLRVGITPMLYEAVLHRLLKDFLKEQPHLILTMETGLTEMMVDWLLRDQVELAFASMMGSHPGIEAIALIETHSVVLMPPGHPLMAKHAIGVEDLAEVPLITMTRRYPSRHRIEQMFRRAGVPMRLRAETNLSGTICDLVRMGQGVAILNALSWGGTGRGDLEARPLTPRLVNRYGVLHLADRGFSRPAQQLIAAIRCHLAQTMGTVYLGEE